MTIQIQYQPRGKKRKDELDQVEGTPYTSFVYDLDDSSDGCNVRLWDSVESLSMKKRENRREEKARLI
jgi:hypothetical protein